MIKICRDFEPGPECCPSCHDGVATGQQDLLVIYEPDGSIYARVCCRKAAAAKEALREVESE